MDDHLEFAELLVNKSLALQANNDKVAGLLMFSLSDRVNVP